MYPGHFATLTPDKPAVVMSDSGATLTYAELDERSVRLARVLAEAGLRPGDDVALLTENSLRTYEVYWAALRSGLYITAIDHHLQLDEVAYIVDDCEAKALVVSEGLADVAAPLATRATGLRRALSIGPVDGYDDYEAAAGRDDRRTPGAVAAGQGDALQLRHHRPTEGHQGTVADVRGRGGRRPPARAVRPALRLRRRRRAGRDRALPSDALAVGADDVRPDAHTGRARRLRPVLAPARDPRRRAVPGRGQAEDDRVVGPARSCRSTTRRPRRSASR